MLFHRRGCRRARVPGFSRQILRFSVSDDEICGRLRRTQFGKARSTIVRRFENRSKRSASESKSLQRDPQNPSIRSQIRNVHILK